MTNVRVIPHSAFTTMLWPNGAGTSRQIASDPAGSRASECSWQFSTALIERSTPFSFMPGIDRVLTLIDGDGFRLDLDGLPPIEVSQRFLPVAFPGDRSTYCHATTGKRIVLNLLLRRDACTASVSTLRSGDVLMPPLQDETLLIFALGGGIALHGANGRWALEDGDAGVFGPGCETPQSITISGTGTLYRAAVTQLPNEQDLGMNC